jgi:septum formation protein
MLLRNPAPEPKSGTPNPEPGTPNPEPGTPSPESRVWIVSVCMLILASASPRRAELLTSAGFLFEVAPADVDETPAPEEAATLYALRVARAKAGAAAAARADADRVVLAADTVVAVQGQILGKPVDSRDATRMLRLLADRTHEVHTAVAVRRGSEERDEVVTTRVRFLPLSEAEIAWYVASGEPEGKAGAYAIQGRGARFIDWIEGSWSNVVGLPIATVYRLLEGP